MLNKVQIIGRLGKDPETRYTQGGQPICNLNVATDESYKDQSGNVESRVEWHKIVVFSRAAENCQNYLRKGSLVYVEGSLQTRKWQDQNGQERYTTEIKAQRVQFLDRRNDNAQGQGSTAQFQAQAHGQRNADEGPAFRYGGQSRPAQQGQIPGWDTPPQPVTVEEVPF